MLYKKQNPEAKIRYFGGFLGSMDTKITCDVQKNRTENKKCIHFMSTYSMILSYRWNGRQKEIQDIKLSLFPV